MDKLLKLPRGELAALAAHQRKEHLKREFGDEPQPLFGEVRAFILRTCNPARERAVRAIFERDPFGELERLVTKTILDLLKRVAKEQLENEHWLSTVAKLSGRSFQEMRVVTLEFLDTDILQLSPENCVAFLEPLMESWDIDLPNFELQVVLHPKVSQDSVRKFQFSEQPSSVDTQEPGFVEFLRDKSLSGSATHQEIAVLGGLRFSTMRPTSIYYYRELQSLRDPLHFAAAAPRS
jgi:hypothetical protein